MIAWRSLPLGVSSMFSEQETELSLGQLIERFGLGKSTTHRYATSLRQSGLLRYDGRSGRYSLGMRLVQLGQLAQVGLYVTQVAAPHMERLANELNETAVLSIWDGEGSVVVRVADAPRRLVYIGVRVGSRGGGVGGRLRVEGAHCLRLRVRDGAQRVRVHGNPAVGDGRRGGRELQRRREHVSLADAHAHGVAGVPLLPEALLLPLLRGREARELAVGQLREERDALQVLNELQVGHRGNGTHY